MSKIKIFLILSGYQLTWLMCVFGELWYNSYIPGLIFGLIFLTICIINSDNKRKTLLIVFFLFPEFIKQIVKKNKPHIKPGRKLLYNNSPKTHVNQVNW